MTRRELRFAILDALANGGAPHEQQIHLIGWPFVDYSTSGLYGSPSWWITMRPGARAPEDREGPGTGELVPSG